LNTEKVFRKIRNLKYRYLKEGISDAPKPLHRNKFLADAMVNLNMIDFIGSGIKRMFLIQHEKFFPLPNYEFENRKVKVTFTGKVIDMNYAKKLASIPDLSLQEIILRDKVAKINH
jgi:Predicted transcriptional regulator containing an HTH domain and an uncharacterized domain shared with the mammalian protein Schlafen